MQALVIRRRTLILGFFRKDRKRFMILMRSFQNGLSSFSTSKKNHISSVTSVLFLYLESLANLFLAYSNKPVDFGQFKIATS
jgi:hypothetical protein